MKDKKHSIARIGLAVIILLLASILVSVQLRPNLRVAEAREVAPAAQTMERAYAPPEQAEPGTITVVGEGKVNAEPDVARINIGIEVVGDTVKDSSNQAADIMEMVIASLEAQAVTGKDIQTSGYNVWVERPYGPEGMPSDQVRYHVGNTVIVTIRDLDKVGAVLDGTIEAGANNIYGVTFSVADPKPLMSEAREKAVADARAKAQELAELNGVALGQVLSISEVIVSGGTYVGDMRAAAFAEGLGGGGGPISPGELEMVTQLQITYAIQ
jgi:uncharacterized protein YggE